MSVCYISLFYNINRDKWKQFGRSFDTYLEHFKPFVDMFSQDNENFEMVLLLDKQHVTQVKSLFKENTRITIIEIDEEFLQTNFPMWKTLSREREIMESDEFKKIIPERLKYPEHHIPEYTLINHCKIDAICYVIREELTSFKYYAWVDFGYFQQKHRITKSFIDINKLDLDRINYTLINPITEKDNDVLYTIKNAPERFGGFFFFGSREKMLEYQTLFHTVLNEFQNIHNLTDDDQHLAMVCYFKKPDLFKLHCLGGWHRALAYFAIKIDKVSVVIPTYNRFKYLLNSIESVKKQTYSNVEIIVVNDGSTEEDYYTNKLKSVLPEQSVLIHLGVNTSKFLSVGRAAYTRNIGIKIASGDYIAFLDDDDIWFSDKLELQMNNMKINNCKMSCTEGLIGNGEYDKTKTYKRYNTEYFKDFFTSIDIHHFASIWDKKFLLRHNSCITSSVILQKDVIDKIGYMPYKRVGEDYEYWLRALQFTNCVFIEKPLIYYDLNHGRGSLY